MRFIIVENLQHIVWTENAKKQKNKTTANIRFSHSDSNPYNWKITRGIDHWNGLHSAFRQLFHLEAAKRNSASHPLQLASQNWSQCLSETTLVALQLEMKRNNLGLWPNQSTKLHQKLVNFQKGDSLVSLDLQKSTGLTQWPHLYICTLTGLRLGWGWGGSDASKNYKIS